MLQEFICVGRLIVDELPVGLLLSMRNIVSIIHLTALLMQNESWKKLKKRRTAAMTLELLIS